jgi:hypothetical protein
MVVYLPAVAPPEARVWDGRVVMVVVMVAIVVSVVVRTLRLDCEFDCEWYRDVLKGGGGD